MENIELKKNIYRNLRNGDLGNAEDLTLKGMEEDIHNQDYEKILKIIKFWQNRQELFRYEAGGGEALIREWDKFIDFCNEQRIDNKKAVISIKNYVYGRSVEFLIESYRLSPVPERDTLILLGETFYEIGILDKAIETLEYALSLAAGDADTQVYTLLGDIYYEIGENDSAMVMFNEAFLKFPQLVNIDRIEYPPMKKIRSAVMEDGFRDNEVPEWIPIYGYLYEGLTARKKMEYNDYMEMKEKVLDYEKSLKLDKKVRNIIVPRLINFYLWLLDYFIFQLGAFESAEKVSKRIIELLEISSCRKEIKTKLSARASLLFNNLLARKDIKKGTAASKDNGSNI
jgi:tetratricopeptide (TPR) repeat protein